MDNNEVTYIPYGQDEISQQELMTNLANGIPEYLSGKRWAQKPKNQKAWMAAYQDIIGKGLAGASNSSGVWKVNTNSTIDLDSMSDKDREIYQDAAYYIQQQMARMAPRKKKEEEKKKDQKTFNFGESFKQQLLNNYYGGDEKLFLDPEEGWNSLDAMDEKAGVRGIEKRKERVLSELKKYLENFKDDDYTFEGTSFTDASDARTKIQAAIDALNSSNTTDDAPAFNALGIQFRGLFSNGANEVSKYTKDGKPLTWKEYADYLKSEDQKKVKAEQDKIEAQKANQYDNYKYYNFLNGTPSNAQDFQGVLEKLSNQQALDGNDISRISWAFRQAEKAGGLVNLSKEELAKMPRYASTPGRLKKLQSGLDGIYYDTFSKRLVQPQKGSQQQGVTLQSILDQSSPEVVSQRYKEIQNSKKLSEEDWDIIGADTASMIGDIISIGGGTAGMVGGAVTVASDLYADIRRGKDFWDTIKNVAKNTAWGFAGLIPGVKLAKIGKRAAQLYALYNSWGIIKDEDVRKSWKKLINGEDFTSHDLENLKWTLHAVTGVHNVARSHFTDKALQNKTQKTVVETKNGQKPITQSQVREINTAGGRGGQQKALDKFKEITGEDAKPNQFQFNTEGRKWYNPTRYSQKLRNLTSDETPLKSTTQFNRFAAGRLLVQDRNKPLLLANPFKASTYKGWFTEGGPNRGYYTMALAKSYNNSAPKQNQQQQNNQQQNQQQGQQNQQRTREIPDNFEATGKAPTSPKHNMTRSEWKKANKKLYKDIDKKGRFTEQMPEEGTYEFKDPTGNTHTFKLIQRDDDFLLDIKSSNGTSRQTVLTLDQVKKGIWDNIKQSLNTGLRNDISLPANIIRALQGSAYGWLKQGGTIDKQKIQLYKKIINK